MFFAKTETTTISIDGMHCNHCKAKVESAIKSVKGVKLFNVSLETASASVSYVPSKTTPQDIAAAVIAAGFNASVK